MARSEKTMINPKPLTEEDREGVYELCGVEPQIYTYTEERVRSAVAYLRQKISGNRDYLTREECEYLDAWESAINESFPVFSESNSHSTATINGQKNLESLQESHKSSVHSRVRPEEKLQSENGSSKLDIAVSEDSLSAATEQGGALTPPVHERNTLVESVATSQSLSQADRIRLWKTIIETANDKDPEFSFRLFSELLSQTSPTNARVSREVVAQTGVCGELSKTVTERLECRDVKNTRGNRLYWTMECCNKNYDECVCYKQGGKE